MKKSLKLLIASLIIVGTLPVTALAANYYVYSLSINFGTFQFPSPEIESQNEENDEEVTETIVEPSKDTVAEEEQIAEDSTELNDDETVEEVVIPGNVLSDEEQP